MKIKQVKKFWDNWLVDNYDRFIYKPYLVDYVKKGDLPKIIIQFEDVPHLCYVLTSSEGEVVAYETKRYWEILQSCWICNPKKTKDGKHYSSHTNDYLRSQGEPLLFWESKQAMWNEMMFDEMLSWCLRNVNPNNVIACYGIPEKTSWGADVISKEKMQAFCNADNKRHLYYSFLPMINPYRDDYIALRQTYLEKLENNETDGIGKNNKAYQLTVLPLDRKS